MRTKVVEITFSFGGCLGKEMYLSVPMWWGFFLSCFCFLFVCSFVFNFSGMEVYIRMASRIILFIFVNCTTLRLSISEFLNLKITFQMHSVWDLRPLKVRATVAEKRNQFSFPHF